jgi:Rrf2 family protein
MPLVPRRGLLAIASVVDIAFGSTSRPLSAKVLAERYRLAPRHLEPILQNLVHVGILKGVRGPRGGYEMGRSPADIRLNEVLEAALGPGVDVQIPFRESPLIAAVVMPALAGAESALSHTLAGITVEMLVERARDSGLVEDLGP